MLYKLIREDTVDSTIYKCTFICLAAAELQQESVLVSLSPPIAAKWYDRRAPFFEPGLREWIKTVFGEDDIYKVILAPRTRGFTIYPRMNLAQGSVYIILPLQTEGWIRGPHKTLGVGELYWA